MEQLSMVTEKMCNEEVAKRYYNEIVLLLCEQNMGYDTDMVQLEHRKTKKDEYDAILMFEKPCFHIKGKLEVYLYFNRDFEKLINECDIPYEPSKQGRWARVTVDALRSFAPYVDALKKLYEQCLRDADSFGCCGSYEECSDAGQCIKKDIMFSGRCIYRQNLLSGKIFYGKNKNI